MPKVFNRAIQVGGEDLKIGTYVVTVLEFDADGNVLKARGANVPADSDKGFAKGCKFIKTSGGAGTTVYTNEGSASSADFNTPTPTSLVDSNGNTAVETDATASAVNHVKITNDAAGNPATVTIAPAGNSTNINIVLKAKGSGQTKIGEQDEAYNVRVGGTVAGLLVLQGDNSSGTNLAYWGGSDSAVNIVQFNAGSTPTNSVFSTLAPLQSSYAMNYIGSTGGSNNAITATLSDYSGNIVAPPLAAGLRLTIKLAHSLQAGANTLNYNSGGNKAIKSHRNPANDIGTAYVSGGIIEVIYDGTQWLDLSQ